MCIRDITGKTLKSIAPLLSQNFNQENRFDHLNGIALDTFSDQRIINKYTGIIRLTQLP